MFNPTELAIEHFIEQLKHSYDRSYGRRQPHNSEIIANIELTRFPVPQTGDHHATEGFPSLVRAADSIRQLSDPRYLKKINALFFEFAETGVNESLGYQHPGDLRRKYPTF